MRNYRAVAASVAVGVTLVPGTAAADDSLLTIDDSTSLAERCERHARDFFPPIRDQEAIEKCIARLERGVLEVSDSVAQTAEYEQRKATQMAAWAQQPGIGLLQEVGGSVFKTLEGIAGGVTGLVTESTLPEVRLNAADPVPTVNAPEAWTTAGATVVASAAGAANTAPNMVQALPTRSDAYSGRWADSGRIVSAYQEDSRVTSRRTGSAAAYRAMAVVLATNVRATPECKAQVTQMQNRLSIREDMNVYDYAPKGYAPIEAAGTVTLQAGVQASGVNVGVSREWTAYKGERDATHTILESGREGTYTNWYGRRSNNRTVNLDNVLVAEHPSDGGWTVHFDWNGYIDNIDRSCLS